MINNCEEDKREMEEEQSWWEVQHGYTTEA